MIRPILMGARGAACLLVLATLGCDPVASLGSRDWMPGITLGTSAAVELGPLGGPSIVAGGTAAAWRIEGFGGTTLELAISGGDDSHLFIEGPLGDEADEPPPGAAPRVAETQGSAESLSVSLGLGVYRVVVGSGAGSPAVRLASACTARCSRPVIDLGTLVSELAVDGRLPIFEHAVADELAARVLDPIARAALTDQAGRLDAIDLARFPTVPLASPVGERPLVDAAPALGPTPLPAGAFDGDLILSTCDRARATPAPIDGLPELAWGPFPARTFTRCQAAASYRLAQLLDALTDGATVSYRGRTCTAPTDLVSALIAVGDTVSVVDERSFAAPLRLRYDYYDVRWPLWIDTGLTVGNGDEVTVPAGVSRLSWRIDGPDLHARVAFEVGPGGAGFVPDTDDQPGWTGRNVRSTPPSIDDGPGPILAGFDAAARYRRRVEREQLAYGLPACGGTDDASAAIEVATGAPLTIFPLLRSSALAGEPLLDDGLDGTMAGLPHDGDQAPDRRDVLRRLLAMLPFDVASPDLPDDSLRAVLGELAAEVQGY